MRIPSNIPATNPHHVARVYGKGPGGAAGGVQPAQEPSRQGGPERLVAGVVPGRVDFSGQQARPVGTQTGAEALQMYRHPADKNAAATGVSLGRTLDVSG